MLTDRKPIIQQMREIMQLPSFPRLAWERG